MSQKVLIIGANGMLGGYLKKEFGSSSQVLSWDISEIDITKREMVFEKIQKEDPDVIINSAAFNAVDKAEEEEGEKMAFAINATGPKNLAEVAKKIGAIFVTYTSDYVFSGEKKDGYREEDETHPINKYGLSKAEGEKMVKEVGGSYYIIRTSKLFGKEGKGENVKKSFLSIMKELSEKMSEIKVVDEELSCFTYTKDLAEVSKFLVFGNYPSGVYHVVNEGPLTWFGCAKEFFSQLNKKISSAHLT